MRLRRSVFSCMTAIVILALSGCASWTKPIAADEVPTGKDSYYYGKFEIDTPKYWLAIGGYQTMGFVFSCDGGKKYTVRFVIDQPIQVFRLNPATCSFTEVIYTDSDGIIVDRKTAPKGVIESITTTPGAAYYIGDYKAVSKSTTSFNSVNTTWEVKEISNNYEATTSAMKYIFPHMTFMPTHNLSSAPELSKVPTPKPVKAPTYKRPVQNQ